MAASNPCPGRLAHSCSTNTMVGAAPSGECRLIHERIHPTVRCRAATAEPRPNPRRRLIVAHLERRPGAADGRTRRSKITHPYQPSPIPLSGRPAHRPFRGLLGVHSRCGLHTRAVTKFVTVTRRLQTFRRLHVCSGCFRLERSPGGPCTHWKSAALSRRTPIAVIDV